MLSPQSQPSTFCLAFLRRVACIGKWLSQAVFKPYVFLRGLLLLAGDVEPNPGPIQGRQRGASCQHSWMCCEPHNGSGGCGGRCVYSGVSLVDTMQVFRVKCAWRFDITAISMSVLYMYV